MLKTIILNKNGYDPFIDALKGVAIFFVLLNHCLPEDLRKTILFNFWGGEAVPLFFLIQSFHYFKSGLETRKRIKIWHIIYHIVLPFVISELFIILIKSIKIGLPGAIIECFLLGGYGPGEYYIWVYLQFMCLFPLLSFFMKRLPSRGIVILFVVTAILLELFSCLVIGSSRVYKYLFFRYFFLIYLGYLWSTKDIVLNIKTIVLSLISLAFIYFFDYTNIDCSPIFYSLSWRPFHWICYFYTSWLFIFILHLLFTHFPHFIKRFICFMGRNSWWIFCSQLVVFTFITPSIFGLNNRIISGVTYIVSTILLSLLLSIMKEIAFIKKA